MINIDDRILGEVDESQLFLLCAIAKHMGSNAKAWPSNETLCKTTRWSESKLLRVKKSAIVAGLLGSESRYINNAQKSNLYQIKTRRIGVMVNLADITPPSTNEAPPPSRMNTPPLQEWRTEVLTNEVLTNEQQQEGFSAAEILIKSITEFEGVTMVEKVDVEERSSNSGMYAPPPAPRRFEAFDIDKATGELKGNEFSAENFARITGTPAAQMLARFTAEVDAFVLEQKGRKTVYNRFDEFSGHFFNWSRSRVRARSQPGAPAQSNSPVPTNIRRL